MKTFIRNALAFLRGLGKKCESPEPQVPPLPKPSSKLQKRPSVKKAKVKK